MLVERILKQIENGLPMYLAIFKKELTLEVTIDPADVSVSDGYIEVDGGKRKFTMEIDLSDCKYDTEEDAISSSNGEIIIVLSEVEKWKI